MRQSAFTASSVIQLWRTGMKYGEIITSRNNPLIKLYRKLSSSKKERSSLKMFVLEGVRIVFDALKENAPLCRIFITESACLRYGSELESYEEDNLAVTVISDELGSYISSTEQPQGIFAQCRMPEQKSLDGFIKKDKKYIVLYKLQDPGNAGMIIRTADALGIDGVIFSESCDVFSPKVIRSTMGSVFRLPLLPTADINEVFECFAVCGIRTYASVIDKDAEDIKSADFSGGAAVLIGNEGSGLPDDITGSCMGKVTIKMHGNIDSLNAAMATGIIMWELKKFE